MLLFRFLNNTTVLRMKYWNQYPYKNIRNRPLCRSLQIHLTKKYERTKREHFNFCFTIPLSTICVAANVVCCDKGILEKDEIRFFKSCLFGLSHEVEKLIRKGIDVNRRHHLGWTPLLIAVVNGRYEVIECLLQAGADPNLSDDYINPNRTANEKGMHPIEGIY